MAEPEIKVPSLQERLANVQSQRGVYKFNRATVAAGGKTLKVASWFYCLY